MGQIVLWTGAALLAVVMVAAGVSAIRQDVEDLRTTPKDGK
ncbi:hypothetical protein [Amycolatopsis sp. WAC 04182]|nr:hypothetical protein [Amycolatopsis sp. WAC 04182]